MNKKILVCLYIILLILFAGYIRRFSFWLPHWQGDQGHYLSLAMKLELYGLDGYNLRGIDLNYENIPNLAKVQLLYPSSSDPNKEGHILSALKGVGYDYYDQPLFWKSPLLPYVILLSHKAFTEQGYPYKVLISSIGDAVKKIRPKEFLYPQLYLSIIPFFFNVLTVLFVFLLARKLFSIRIGVYASIMMAVNAINIWVSNYIWTENLLAFFITLSFLLFIIGKERNNIIFYFLSGVSCGLAILSKQPAVLIIVPVWFLSVSMLDIRITGPNKILRLIFNRDFLVFAITAVLVAAPWFIKVFEVYGNPFFVPSLKSAVDITGWSTVLAKRPHPLILFTIGMVYLSPIFGFAYLTLGSLLREIMQFIKGRQGSYNFLFLWVWVLIFLFAFSILNSKEERHMLCAYPAIAILASCFLDRVRKVYLRYFPSHILTVEIFIGIVFLLHAYYSISIAQEAVFSGRLMILKPF